MFERWLAHSGMFGDGDVNHEENLNNHMLVKGKADYIFLTLFIGLI